MKQTDNTIALNPKTLTPAQLREALDAWAKEQPGVFHFSDEYEEWTTMVRRPSEIESEYPESCVTIANLEEEERTFELFSESTYLVLTGLAIEHRYIPWLQLAASLSYTGAAAARVALGAFRRPTEQEEEERLAQAEVLFWNDED